MFIILKRLLHPLSVSVHSYKQYIRSHSVHLCQHLYCQYYFSSYDGETVDYLVKIDREKAGWTRELVMKLRLEIGGALWIHEENPTYTLGKNPSSPGQFGFIVPKE